MADERLILEVELTGSVSGGFERSVDRHLEYLREMRRTVEETRRSLGNLTGGFRPQNLNQQLRQILPLGLGSGHNVLTNTLGTMMGMLLRDWLQSLRSQSLSSVMQQQTRALQSSLRQIPVATLFGAQQVAAAMHRTAWSLVPGTAPVYHGAGTSAAMGAMRDRNRRMAQTMAGAAYLDEREQHYRQRWMEGREAWYEQRQRTQPALGFIPRPTRPADHPGQQPRGGIWAVGPGSLPQSILTAEQEQTQKEHNAWQQRQQQIQQEREHRARNVDWLQEQQRRKAQGILTAEEIPEVQKRIREELKSHPRDLDIFWARIIMEQSLQERKLTPETTELLLRGIEPGEIPGVGKVAGITGTKGTREKLREAAKRIMQNQQQQQRRASQGQPESNPHETPAPFLLPFLGGAAQFLNPMIANWVGPTAAGLGQVFSQGAMGLSNLLRSPGATLRTGLGMHLASLGRLGAGAAGLAVPAAAGAAGTAILATAVYQGVYQFHQKHALNNPLTASLITGGIALGGLARSGYGRQHSIQQALAEMGTRDFGRAAAERYANSNFSATVGGVQAGVNRAFQQLRDMAGMLAAISFGPADDPVSEGLREQHRTTAFIYEMLGTAIPGLSPLGAYGRAHELNYALGQSLKPRNLLNLLTAPGFEPQVLSAEQYRTRLQLDTMIAPRQQDERHEYVMQILNFIKNVEIAINNQTRQQLAGPQLPGQPHPQLPQMDLGQLLPGLFR